MLLVVHSCTARYIMVRWFPSGCVKRYTSRTTAATGFRVTNIYRCFECYNLPAYPRRSDLRLIRVFEKERVYEFSVLSTAASPTPICQQRPTSRVRGAARVEIGRICGTQNGQYYIPQLDVCTSLADSPTSRKQLQPVKLRHVPDGVYGGVGYAREQS